MVWSMISDLEILVMLTCFIQREGESYCFASVEVMQLMIKICIYVYHGPELQCLLKVKEDLSRMRKLTFQPDYIQNSFIFSVDHKDILSW